MKFDVVIGNPPYQDSANRQIYPYFMLNALDISSAYVCMIVKNDWLAVLDESKDQIFNKVRTEAFINKKAKFICDFSKQGEVFKNVGVAVCYYLMDHNNTGDCTYKQIIGGIETTNFVADFSGIGTLIKNQTLSGIVKRVKQKKGLFGDTLNIYNTPFGFDTNGVKPDDYINGYASNKQTTKTDIKLILSDDRCEYVNEAITKKETRVFIPYYKVVCGEKIHAWEHVQENIVTDIRIINPYEVCSGSWSLIEAFKGLEEAQNFEKYIKTRFARALIKAGYPSYKRPNKYYFRFLPLQDFTSNSDIDWNQSISDIDKKLYKKYNLSKEEINYIESTIKEMK